MKRNKGFTLVEIMIVVAIIGLLAAIAIPSFIKARTNSQTNACINNLRQIDAAKEQAALAEKWVDGQAIAAGSAEETTVNSYIKGGAPDCPADGTYTYAAIGADPTCSIAGHALP